MEAAETEWLFQARDAQLPPYGDWRTWLIMGGRGSGKTRAGAEWTSGMALGLPPFARTASGQIALVGETLGDAREVMVDGPSGILAVSRLARPAMKQHAAGFMGERRGGVALFFGRPRQPARTPVRRRMVRRACEMENPQETWDMLQFGLRLGTFPRQVVTTTPRAVPLLKTLISDASVSMTHMRTEENAANLAQGFMQTINRRYAGTRLGRQELDGELIEERADALWSRDLIERSFEAGTPELVRIVVAIDPPASSGKASDACGIVVAGLDDEGNGHVLGDASMNAAKPHQWARKAIALFTRIRPTPSSRRSIRAAIWWRRCWLRKMPACRFSSATPRGASFCGLSLWPLSTNRDAFAMPDGFRRWRMKCATSQPVVFPAGGRRTGWMHWSGRWAN